VTGKDRKQESKIQTARVSFKLFRRVDSHDNLNQSNYTSKDMHSVTKSLITNKVGSKDLDLDNESKMAGEFAEQT
jgi:hypothetical protein